MQEDGEGNGMGCADGVESAHFDDVDPRPVFSRNAICSTRGAQNNRVRQCKQARAPRHESPPHACPKQGVMRSQSKTIKNQVEKKKRKKKNHGLYHRVALILKCSVSSSPLTRKRALRSSGRIFPGINYTLHYVAHENTTHAVLCTNNKVP